MSSESSSTGAMTASSTSASRRLVAEDVDQLADVHRDAPSLAGGRGVVDSQVAEPVLGPLEQEQADVLAPLEVGGDARRRC